MTFELNGSALASWAAVVTAAAGAFKVHRKAVRYLDSIDDRFKDGSEKFDQIEESLTEIRNEQKDGAERFALVEDSLTEIKEEQAEIREEQARLGERAKAIDAQLRPNGGGSHHDVIRREIREAIEEAAESNGRRRWRR